MRKDPVVEAEELVNKAWTKEQAKIEEYASQEEELACHYENTFSLKHEDAHKVVRLANKMVIAAAKQSNMDPGEYAKKIGPMRWVFVGMAIQKVVGGSK